ncbi:MAG: hypothetical protein ACRC62_18820 [Microcoleus sp.]
MTEMKLVGATRQALGEFYAQAIDLVDQNLQLLDGWFGYTPEAAVIERIEKHLCTFKGVTQELCK